MSTAPPVDDETLAAAGQRGSRWRVLRRPAVALGLFWFLLVTVLSAGRSVFAPYDPLVQDVYQRLKGPSGAHWLGTDSLGRDVLSRLMYGGPSTLLAAAEVVLVAVLVGVPLGLASGYLRGPVSAVSQRLADLLFALPALVVLMAIVSLFGRGVLIPMAALGIIASASFIRLTSACVQQVRAELFIDAARVSGVRSFAIIVRHVLPNIATPIVIQCTLTFGVGLIVQSGLGFLGLGAQPPSPDWGAMVADSATYVAVTPLGVLPPGLCIALTVIAVNLIGEGLRDARVDATRTRPSRARMASVGPPELPAAARPADVAAYGAVDPAAALSVRDLVVAFGEGDHATTVVDGVSFDIQRGEVVGLVGESGCGKSVTALSLLGLLPRGGHVTAGEIRLLGADATRRRERGRRVGYIPQEPMTSLDPSFTVASHLTELIRRHRRLDRRAARRYALELLTRVEIPNPDQVLRRYPHQLSGGMAQRVLIAMALVGEPELLIADEPTTALDVTVQSDILDLLRSLQRDLGMAMLLITHDFGVVADICQRVVVMYAGQVAEDASADQLFTAPTHPYCAALLGCNPELAANIGRLPAIEGEVPAPTAWPVGCRFADRCSFCIPQCRTAPIPLLGTAEHARRCIRAGASAVDPIGPMLLLAPREPGSTEGRPHADAARD